MKQKESKTSIGNIAALLVFCLLALSLLMTLLFGARIYRSVTERSETLNARRTVSQYVANRIRQADRDGAVSVEDFGGVCALSIRETIDGAVYCTRIYCHEGWMYELFAGETGSFSPEDGEQLLPLNSLSFLLEDGCLTAQAEHTDGSAQTFTLRLRSGEVALP